MLDITPQLISLGGLFTGRLFRIPQYQRSYSWERKHRTDLFEDIETSLAKGKEHFMATIVGLRQEKTTTIALQNHNFVDIVDGQQRITTLIILYKAISNVLSETNDEEKQAKQEIEKTLIKQKYILLLLQTNQNASDYFMNYLREGVLIPANQAKTSADRNLLEAIADCEKIVEKWKTDEIGLIKITEHITNNIKFVYHEINDESLVYSVFEVLNSRGLEVSWLDRLKSILMSIIFDQGCHDASTLDAVRVSWSTIFQTIGTLPVNTEILCFAATLLNENTSKILSDEDSVKSLRKRSEDDCPKVIATISWLEKVAQSVVKVHVNTREVALKKIKQARLVAVAIDLRNDLTAKDKENLHVFCSKAAFCIYGIGRKDARTAVGDYVKLAGEIYRKKLPKEQIENKLSSIIANAIPDLEEKTRQLAHSDCYSKWRNELRYLLSKYEEYLSQKSGQDIKNNEQWSRIWESSASSTIEHIQPQASGREYVDYLGNLFLLPPGINAKLGKKPPADKVDAYRATGFVMSKDIIKSLPQWNKNTVRQRGEEIARWAEGYWCSLVKSPPPDSTRP